MLYLLASALQIQKALGPLPDAAVQVYFSYWLNFCLDNLANFYSQQPHDDANGWGISEQGL